MGNDEYKELFERSADAILIIRDGKFVDCNEATVKMLRYKSKLALLNTHPSQLSPEYQSDGRLSHEKADEMIETAFRKGSNRFEWMHKKADGKIFPVEVLLTAITETGTKTLHVVWRDISERKNQETDMLRLKSIVESTSDLIASTTPDGRIFYTNDAAKKTLGNLNDTNHAQIQDFHPDWALDIIINEGIPHAISNGIWQGESAAFKANGEEIPVSQVIMAHKDLNGTLLYLSTIMRDMSEHYKNRSERLELQNRLHQAQKMEAIGTLSGGIAHDFNNILSGIFGYCQLAKNHIETPLKAKNHINEIIKGSKKAADLIQQILTFSRKSPHQKRPLRIYLVLKEALKLLRASLPSTIDIKEQIDTRSKIMADATKIHQVIMNLCTNAYHAMRETGGTLYVSLSTIKIDIPQSSDDVKLDPGSYVKLEVRDTGSGISKDIQNKIFDPYFTTKKTDKGTGLGLAVVHGIVKEHKGQITLESIEGKGSCFTIHFPVSQEGSHPEKSTIKQDKTLNKGTQNILLVDDEKSILDSTKQLLEHQGYKVTSFTNGVDAFEEFKKNPNNFDLIVSDVTMPGMTGDVLLKNALKIRSAIPIILCSGYSDKLSEDDLMNIGIKHYLQKPILIHDLIFHIQHLLGQKEEKGDTA
ncbi:MAG: ATP-binding protein [Desulfobacula sp.]|nr:ATP-binding protein [Desulfobacula sp.]